MNSRPRKYLILKFEEVPKALVFRYANDWLCKEPGHENIAYSSANRIHTIIPLDFFVGVRYSDYRIYLRANQIHTLDPDAQNFS